MKRAKRENEGKEIPCRSLHMYARTHAHTYTYIYIYIDIYVYIHIYLVHRVHIGICGEQAVSSCILAATNMYYSS
ncbi:hypothetical protein PUN28_003271 [Cardiocondyla obscurior]|uniref:Uncharacterized protein n=1 Tax=Cardiocondyla obscurior TaxID=286306 RepID=A0AAW2GK14_9HYME